MNEADKIKLLEDELEMLIGKAHRSGLYFQDILRVFLSDCVILELQAEVEYWLKQG